MYFEAILIPLKQNPTLALGALASISLCFALKTVLTSNLRKAGEVPTGVVAQFREMESTLEQLRASISEMKPQVPASGPALTGEKRSRALGMLERGDHPEAVAAALGAARGEIELLMKVHRVLARQSA